MKKLVTFLQRSSIERKNHIWVTAVFNDGTHRSGWVKVHKDEYGRYVVNDKDIETMETQVPVPRDTNG